MFYRVVMEDVSAVVLSVPHAVCVQRKRTNEYPCDEISAAFAIVLQKKLQDRAIVTYLQLGNIDRNTCDLNRIECRATPFRLQLTELMKQPVFVLDIHSFLSYSKEGHLHAYVIQNAPAAHYTYEFVNAIHSVTGQQIPIFTAQQGANDIISQAQELGRPALLLELNEQLMDPPTQEKFASAIAEWFQSKIKTSKVAF